MKKPIIYFTVPDISLKYLFSLRQHMLSIRNEQIRVINGCHSQFNTDLLVHCSIISTAL